MNTRVQVARSMVWTALESFGISGLSFIGVVVVARHVMPDAWGVAAMAQSIVQMLNIPVEFLFIDALIRRKDVEQMDYDTAHSVSVLLGVFIFLLCWLLSGSVSHWLGVPEMGPVLAWMGVSLAAMGFQTAIVARQRREMDFRILAIRSFVGRLAGVTIGITVALMGGGVWSLVSQQVLMTTCSTLVLWLWLKPGDRPHFRFSPKHFKDLASFGMHSVSVVGLNFSVQRIFTLFVGAGLSTAAAGYMNLAFRIVDMLRDIVINAVYQLALPMFSRHSDDLARIKQIYMTAVRFTCAVTFPVFIGLALCSSDFVSILLEQKWIGAVPYMELLSCLALISFARLYSNPVLTARGFPQLPLLPDLGALATVVIGMTALHLSGTMTLALAAAVWALRLVISLPIDVYNVRRITHIGLYEQVKGALSPLISVSIMAACLFFMENALLADMQPWLRIIVMAAIGSVVYAASFWLLDGKSVTDLWHFVQLALKRPHPEQIYPEEAFQETVLPDAEGQPQL